MRRCQPFKFAALIALACADPARALDPAHGGTTGLLNVPTAEVQPEGTARSGWSYHDPRPGTLEDIDDYFLSLGFLSWLEVTGRIAEGEYTLGGGIRDLSFNAKARLALPGGAALAVGGTDIGGDAQNFRSTYAVATLPWHSLHVTAGYGAGPDVLDGAFGGIEWRPWEYAGVLVEHDSEDFNGGVKLRSPAFAGGWRVGGNVGYRRQTEDVEYGAHVELPLGREAPPLPSRRTEGSGPPTAPVAAAESARDPEAPADSKPEPAPAPLPPANAGLRAALLALGFEDVRVGVRGSSTQVVRLENRRYNHSATDGIGLALATIAQRADARIERIELTLFTYGVGQATIEVPAAAYRAFLDDPAAHADGVRAALVARPVDGVPTGVTWDPAPRAGLEGAELVAEPVLRTFYATEYGLLDAAFGVRARLTAPLARGLLVNVAAQAPVAESGDYDEGRNFEGFAIEPGFDLALLQYLHKAGPQWSWLWSAGRSQVLQSDLDTGALEQLWTSRDGRHQLRTRFMALHGREREHHVALAGYAWHDPVLDYAIGVTGGRFYAGDAGLRLEASRWFGDTQATLFVRGASGDDIAAGVALSLPLTPRRDAAPGFVQVKGPRRWGHSLATTLNDANTSNRLRPLLLYEPQLDLDLRRDFGDAGRLGEATLRDEVPRLYEAAELWGR